MNTLSISMVLPICAGVPPAPLWQAGEGAGRMRAQNGQSLQTHTSRSTTKRSTAFSRQ